MKAAFHFNPAEYPEHPFPTNGNCGVSEMDRILRPNQVAFLVGLGDRRIRQLESEGKFPRRFRIYPDSNAAGFLESEIEAWIKATAANREIEAVES